MPFIYRTMFADGDKPRIGSAGKMLGVRSGDITVGPNGMVSPGTGGMSVSPGWRDLLGHLIPKRLRPLAPHATGKDSLVCWRMDEIPFAEGPVAARLGLRIDPKNDRHGLIEPDRKITLDEFQAALAATQNLWVRDEA